MRDEKTVSALEALGWEVLVIWQCELKNTASLAKKIRDFLGERSRNHDLEVREHFRAVR